MSSRAGLILLAFGVAFLSSLFTLTITGYTHAPKHPAKTSVTQFNDGFADAKQDDCQRGFQPACDWLHRQ